jgi:hypothetical protein
MNKRAFSLTLLLSIPTALLSGTAIPSQKDLFLGAAAKKAVLDLTVQVAHEGLDQLYDEGKLSEQSAAHKRLMGMSDDDRTYVIIKAQFERIKNSLLSEQDALNAILPEHARRTAHDWALQFVNEARAKSLGDSAGRNVETAIKNNRNCTGYDIARNFGHSQHIGIIQSLRCDGTGRNNTDLPSIY